MKRGRVSRLRLLVVSVITISSLIIAPLLPSFSAYADPDPGQTTTAEQTTEEPKNCEESFYGFGWLFCPGQNLISGAVNLLMGWIGSFMQWTLLSGDHSKDILDIWQKFVSIANILFAIAFLVMIYSMATSVGMSSYGIKKTVPKLIIIAVTVNLSFYICAMLVDVSNIAGVGIYNLILDQTVAGSGWNIIGNAMDSAAGFGGVVLAMFLFGWTALLGLGIIVIALIFRQVALLLLVIISPVAVVLYLLPNTEKWGKKWFDLFTRLLIVYPIFMATWAAARLASNIATVTASGANVATIGVIIRFICALAPALLILPIFKFSGGLMGSVAGAMQKSGIAKGLKSADADRRKRSLQAIGRSMAQSRTSTAMRRGVSSAALAAQNRYGNKRYIGGIARSAAVNSIISNAANTEAKHDEDAMKQAKVWSERSLTYGQKMEIFETGGTYTTTTPNGTKRRVTLTDPHKIRAAIGDVQKSASYSSWHKAAISNTQRYTELTRQHRDREAEAIRKAYTSAAFAEKSPFTPGDVANWQSGKWDGTHENGKSIVESAIPLSTVNYVNSLSPSAIADMNPAQQISMISQLSKVDTRKFSTNDVAAYNHAITSVSSAADRIMHSKNLESKLSEQAREVIIDIRDNGLRNAEQQTIAIKLNVDAMVKNFNDIDKPEADIADIIRHAKSIVADKKIFEALHERDQVKIKSIADSDSTRDREKIITEAWLQ